MHVPLATQNLDEPAPATLRSPPSTVRVRDRALCVELTRMDWPADVGAREDEPPTRRYGCAA